jgi:hypothetical protein
MILAALCLGIGYGGQVSLSRSFIGGPYGTYVDSGNASVSLSPFLYPVSFLFGKSAMSELFTRTASSVSSDTFSGRHYYNPDRSASNIGTLVPIDEIKREAMFALVYPEFLENLPFYFCLAVSIIAVAEAIRRKKGKQIDLDDEA